MQKKPFTVKLDTNLIENFKLLCKKVGITPTAAMKMFMTESIRSKKIAINRDIKQNSES